MRRAAFALATSWQAASAWTIVIGFLAAARITWQSSLPTVANGRMARRSPRENGAATGLPNGIDGDAHIAVGTILESHRTRQAGSQFAMDLGFGGAGSDRTPGNQVGGVLRGDRVEEFGGTGQPISFV